MINSELPYSRPVATALRLGEDAPDRHRFIDKQVLLTGEPALLSTCNGRETLLTSLRLLVRICSNVSVSLPSGFADLLGECRLLADEIAFGAPVRFVDAPEFGRFGAILCVGTTARPSLPWTVVNSDGWLARVSSGRTNLPATCTQANPIGAVAAASLGVVEVFKRLICVKERRGRLLDGLRFSLYSCRSDETDPGPPLPDSLPLELLVVGGGAICNGIAYLLSRLPTCGQAWIVDRQRYEPENLGTCMMIGPTNLGMEKAKFIAGVLSQRLDATGFAADIRVFRERLGREIPYPRVVVNGLDNIDARYDVQGLWPDLIIDGAIGDFACQVSRHSWHEDSACLMCMFRHPPGESAEKVASRATGLTASRTQQPEASVDENDVAVAPAAHREWLRARIDRKICSVVQEGVAQALSTEQLRQGFEPSVPFVACLGACMVVAELTKHVARWPTSLESRFQFDSLAGPAFGQSYAQARRKDCLCISRRRNIEAVRNKRGLKPAGLPVAV